MADNTPQWSGSSAFLHGFARSDIEGPPSGHPSTWWGSATLALPVGVTQTVVRLQAEDGAHSRGILYRRGDETTVVVFAHPRGDFSCHYLTPVLLDAGVAVFGGQVRSFANDSDCIHESLLADIAAEIRYLRSLGFEKVVLLGNSGGGPLFTLYQAQAGIEPPGRLTDTPAGDPYDLNALDLPQADTLILVAAHLGEGLYALNSLDPSMVDESDPLSCDPSLDMYNPDNGYRKPPESSRYTAEFLARYRQAQRARCERLDAVARDDIRRRREAREAMSAPGFAELPPQTRLATIRRAEVSRYLTVARMDANPAFTDMTIHPSPRAVGSLFGGDDPHAYNYRLGGPASVVTPEAWLSTWSGLSSRANVPANIAHVHVPLLVINYTRDTVIFPDQVQEIIDRAGTTDTAFVEIDSDHYGLPTSGTREDVIKQVGDAISSWLATPKWLKAGTHV
jgi:pimeloyl-ACP methyl ester carboxylesterase